MLFPNRDVFDFGLTASADHQNQKACNHPKRLLHSDIIEGKGIAGFSCSPHHGAGTPVTQVFTLLLSVWNHGSLPVMKQPSYRKKKHDKEENRNQHMQQ